MVKLTPGYRSNRSRHGHEGGAGLVNCYSEDLGDEGVYPYAVYGVEGHDLFGTVTGAGVRAAVAVDTDLYCVAGRTINRVDTSGSSEIIGGIIGDGLVTMARNRASSAQVGICADGIFKIATALGVVDVDDADLPPANSVCNANGYFMLTIPDGRVYSTSLEDGTAIDALDFKKAESNPDGLVRGFYSAPNLVLFGDKSLEIFNDVGGAEFPFARTTAIQVGCSAPGSPAQVGTGIAFIANDGTVRLMEGYQPNVISTPEIERLIDSEPDKSAIMGMSWQRRGKTSYALSGTTWSKVYELGKNRWHDRESYGLSRWRMATATDFNGRVVFGDYAGSQLYTANDSSQTENGNPVVMTIELVPKTGFPARSTHHAVWIDFEPGVGIPGADEHNSAPVMILEWSEDGGKNYTGHRELDLGTMGDDVATAVARKLGQAGRRGRKYRLRCSADVVKAVFGGELEVEKDAD